MHKTMYFGIILNLIISLAQFSAANDVEEQRAIIKNIIGQVEVNIGQAKWRHARVGMSVKMGDDIRTYVESSADMELESGSIIKIGENTVVSISKLLQGSESNGPVTNLKIGTGKIWANVKKLTKANSAFEFETPTAVASIRGTRLGVSVDLQGTAVDVFEGLVLVREKSTNKTVSVTTKKSAIIRVGGKDIDIIDFSKKIPSDSSHKSKQSLLDPFADTASQSKSDSTTNGSKPVFLEIQSPSQNTIVKDPFVLINGKTNGDAVIDIGGKEVSVNKEGLFSSTSELKAGFNTIAVNARRGSFAKTTSLLIEYRPTLLLNITNIIDNMEVTSPDLTVDVEITEGAKYSINGVEGAVKIRLNPGKNNISIRAWDHWNATADRSLSVIYQPASGLTLFLSSPKDGLTIADPMIQIAGDASPGAKITVNNIPIMASPSGAFSSTIPIPDEAHDYGITVVAKLGENEINEERTVTYAPTKAALSLSIATPFEGQIIKQNLLRITGKTSPRAAVNVNGRPGIVSSQGNFTYDLQFSERDIGSQPIDIIASDDNKEITKTVNVVVDPTSPFVNTSVPSIVVQEQCSQATRTGKMAVDVFDRTPEDQITLLFQNNGRSEEFTMAPGDRQFLALEEGKNTYTIKAYDRAHNMSNVISCVVYYLSGPLVIDIRDPMDNPMVIDNLPPMPRNVSVSQMRVEVEIEDGIGNVPETLRYCRLIGDGKTIQMSGNNNYRYNVTIPVTYGSHAYSVQVEDISGNLMSKRLDVIVK